MILPPAIMRIRIKEEGKRKISLWIPIFLFWPIGILVLVLLIPVVLVLALFRSFTPRAGGLFEIIILTLTIIFAFREFEIEVEQEDKQVLIKFK
jgi:hypothetical protein